MNKDELLAEALKRYSIGTVFLSAYSGNKYTVDKIAPQWSNLESIVVGSRGAVYYSGKWAEIIQQPNQITNNYELY